MTRDAELWRVAIEAASHRLAAEGLYEVLTEADATAPGVIVEVGCEHPGHLYAWRAAFPAADVYAIAADSVADTYGATVLVGDTRDRGTLQRLRDQLGGRDVDVMSITGGPDCGWQAYAPLVRAGGLFIRSTNHHAPSQVGVVRMGGTSHDG